MHFVNTYLKIRATRTKLILSLAAMLAVTRKYLSAFKRSMHVNKQERISKAHKMNTVYWAHRHKKISARSKSFFQLDSRIRHGPREFLK